VRLDAVLLVYEHLFDRGRGSLENKAERLMYNLPAFLQRELADSNHWAGVDGLRSETSRSRTGGLTLEHVGPLLAAGGVHSAGEQSVLSEPASG
jgi:hypothetical protein